MAKKKSYKEAYEELQAIVAELESGRLDIDVLTEKIKLSTELIKICKDKLREVEEDISDIR